METKINPTKPELNKLTSFRQAIYKCFTRAADALFELLDALLCSPGLLSFPELSCAPVFRRQWPSVYEALQDGQLDRDQLLKHCVEILPANPPSLAGGRSYRVGTAPSAHPQRSDLFANQSLRWKLPPLSTPAQGEVGAVTLPRGYPITLSGASDRTRPAPSLAESSARSNPRPDVSGNRGSFGRDWYTRRPAQTSRKILRLALRTDPQ